MTFVCAISGREWATDPRLAVTCPTCLAPAGVNCRRPSGHRAAKVHVDREAEAVLAGELGAFIPNGSAEGRRGVCVWWRRWHKRTGRPMPTEVARELATTDKVLGIPRAR